MQTVKKGILLLNGEPYQGKIEQKNRYTVCCDGAYIWAKDLQIDMHIGDFDSSTEKAEHNLVYPKEKDLTDGELGLRYLIEKGCRHIQIYGGGGKRDDHFFGNLQLLLYACRRGIWAELITNYATIYCVDKYVVFTNKRNKTISFAPFFGDVHILDSEGLQYSLKNITLCAEECRGISNCIQKEKASITIEKGVLLVFEVDKMV